MAPDGAGEHQEADSGDVERAKTINHFGQPSRRSLHVGGFCH